MRERVKPVSATFRRIHLLAPRACVAPWWRASQTSPMRERVNPVSATFGRIHFLAPRACGSPWWRALQTSPMRERVNSVFRDLLSDSLAGAACLCGAVVAGIADKPDARASEPRFRDLLSDLLAGAACLCGGLVAGIADKPDAPASEPRFRGLRSRSAQKKGRSHIREGRPICHSLKATTILIRKRGQLMMTKVERRYVPCNRPGV